MKRSFFPLATIALAGCSLLEPGITRERLPAYVRFGSEPARIDAPDTVAAGVPFSVTVPSFGDGCIARGDTQVEIGDMVVQLRPFDIFTTSMPKNDACTRRLALYDHTASVRLDKPGVAIIRAIGRVDPGDSTTTLERQVIVR